MRIAMIHTPLTIRSGGERQILRLAIELQKLGHEVEIFTNAVDEETCYPNLLNKVAINVVSHPLVRFRSLFRRIVKKRAVLYGSTFPRLINIGRNIPEGFDIINNHNFPTEWAAFFARERLKIPAVWMCNEPPFWFWNPIHMKRLSRINWPLCELFDKFAVKYIDKIVVLSRVTESLVRKIYNRSSKIVRSGVDIQFFHNASGEDVRARHGLEKDFVLLQVGNMDPLRRQSDSIKALYHLSKNYANVKLILDGTGSREALIKLSEQLGVRDKVLFFHTVNDEELARVYAACDVCVFPCQSPWGLAAIEAMAASKPVIVSDKAGVSEIIEIGVNGIVVDHAKPKDIAKHVESLINDPKLCKKLGENAYENVKDNLSWEKYARNMENVFQEAINGFRGERSNVV